MDDLKIYIKSALNQASKTSSHYLGESYKILNCECGDWSVGDAIELAKVMAQNFHTSMMCLKMQEIRDAIKEKES